MMCPHFFVPIALLFFEIRDYTVLLPGVQLLTVTFGFQSTRCILWPGCVLIRFLHLWTIDVGWLGCECYTRSIIILCTICMVSCPLLLIIRPTQAARNSSLQVGCHEKQVIPICKTYSACLRSCFPCGQGGSEFRNRFPCACRKRRLIMGYKLSYTTGLMYAWSSCMQ